MGERDGISALAVEDDPLGPLAISLHGTPRSGIPWTVSRSFPVGRPIRPPRVSDSRIHPYLFV